MLLARQVSIPPEMDRSYQDDLSSIAGVIVNFACGDTLSRRPTFGCQSTTVPFLRSCLLAAAPFVTVVP